MNVSTCSAPQVRLRLSIPDSVNHYSRYFSSVIFTGRTRRRWGLLQALCAVRSMRSCSSSRMFKSRVEISTFHTHILKDDGSRINDLRRVSFDLFRLCISLRVSSNLIWMCTCTQRQQQHGNRKRAGHKNRERHTQTHLFGTTASSTVPAQHTQTRKKTQTQTHT